MLRRSGARPGDAVLVTGALGAARAGLLALDAGLAGESANAPARVHLLPTARVDEGLAIASSGLATAAIDVSDGFAADLGHLCEASGTGARIFADRLPVSPAARDVAADLGFDPMLAALHGGEDYELIVTCASEHTDALIEAVRRTTGTPLTAVGEITEAPGLRLVEVGGNERSLDSAGWDHFAGAGP